MTLAITTRYTGNGYTATIAMSKPVTIRVSVDHALDSEGNHAAAARKLAERVDFKGDFRGAYVKDGTWVWVNITNAVDPAFTVS
jgi:hypothetical protein